MLLSFGQGVSSEALPESCLDCPRWSAALSRVQDGGHEVQRF